MEKEGAHDWGFRNPKLTADPVLVEEGRVLLVKRKNQPFQGEWAIPGGFVDYGERTEDACVREMREETGLDVEIKRLVGVYSKPGRDPRGHTVSVVYLVERVRGEMLAGDDAAAAGFFQLDGLPKLAFDHAEVMADVKKILGA